MSDEAIKVDAPVEAVPESTVPAEHSEETSSSTLETKTEAQESNSTAAKSSEKAKPYADDISDSKPDAEYDLTVPEIEGKTSEEVEDLMAKVAKQINFYFSDANLPQDKFFFTLTVCNPQGWVPIETIMTFQRMREFEPLGVQFAARAVRRVIKSEGSDPLLSVSEHGLNVRRIRKLEQGSGSSAYDRSVYVKGFGEGDTEENTQEALEKYFEQFGEILAVRKRKEDAPGAGTHSTSVAKKGKFKGSVFAEFRHASDMEKFLALEELPKFTPDGPSMTFMSKDAYVQMKAKEKGIDMKSSKRGPDRHQRSVPGKFNAFKEMAKIEAGELPDLAKIAPSTAVIGKPPAVRSTQRDGRDSNKRSRDRDDDGEDKRAKWAKLEDLTLEYNGVELKCDPTTGEVREPEKVAFTPNAVVKFVNCGKDGDWKDLKQRVIDNGIEKPFIAYPPGSEFGRLAKSDGTEISEDEIRKLNEANIPFGGSQLLWERMPEDAQRDFWVIRANFQGKMLADKQNGERKGNGHWEDRRNGGGRGHGGRGGGRGGRGGRGGGRGGRGGRDGRGGRGGRDRDRMDEDDSGMPPKVAKATNDD
ncbi:hypothetical protein BD324DRAFT_645356 [Kockovaella imperatae]|uniref:HTH La-type RNA-binding domain-containing protein n=1 Tax=Kockovaella imperatae TaxID=4999 RepID=A0A1Y1UIC4_9TREE|nr:hypothetical protein BD324DRAFT_645356 [Kockovaella imperatae]ORX37808.1 hypothetical protein BD324DRAFT_645356 [Kockovaella imperatae]